MNSSSPSPSIPEAAPRRNQGVPLDLAWVLEATSDYAAIQRTLRERPRDTGEADALSEVDRLLHALRAIDLTTLSGDDTPARVADLCARAREPLPSALAAALGREPGTLRTASVCVYHYFLPVAREALAGSGIPIAVVSAGFPAGLSPLRQRIDEIETSVAAGANEIDAVINRSLAIGGEWEALYDEVRAFRAASGDALLKVILGTGDLASGTTIARASRVCILAGADFIKTSTGKEAVNATLPAGLVMLREIGACQRRTGQVAGFKPAGGIRTPEQALDWMRLVHDELGSEALAPERFRIGASGLLQEIVRRLSEIAGGPIDPPTAAYPAPPRGERESGPAY